ncbi:hypothetical protein ACFL1H_05430 [Nanoarchaeota archaeon]
MYRFFGSVITLTLGSPVNYSEKVLIKEIPDEEYKIMREECDSGSYKILKFSLYSEDKLLSFIYGYIKNKNTFQIRRIENVTRNDEDKVPGSKTLPLILEEMEFELKQLGVERLTTNAIASIAPLIVQRYGFSEIYGKTYEQLQNDWFKRIPFIAVGLEKQLTD